MIKKLNELQFDFKVAQAQSYVGKVYHYGLPRSKDLEMIISPKELNGAVHFEITTPSENREEWRSVLEMFVKDTKLGNAYIQINDNNASPDTILKRLTESLEHALAETDKNYWEKLQLESFYNMSARNRAVSLVDKDSFTELAAPYDNITSYFLPLMGKAIAFDDGIVTGVGRIGERTAFILSQEGNYVGGSLGEVGGAKFAAILRLARQTYEKMLLKNPNLPDSKRPVVILSLDTGGVRLQEANAGMLALSEIMDEIKLNQNKVPTISIIGSKIGCFGGMGFVAVATDVLIMSDKGRLGLAGPEVIEQEMGKEELDTSDKPMVQRITGSRHKYIMGDCDYLVEDSPEAFRKKLKDILNQSMVEISSHRKIGSQDLLAKQEDFVKLAAETQPTDVYSIWAHAGNNDPENLTKITLEEFLKCAKRLTV